MLKKGLVTILLTVSAATAAAEPGLSELNRCAVDLCGPAENNQAYYLRGAFGAATAANSKRLQQDELIPALERSLERLRDMRPLRLKINRDLWARKDKLNVANMDLTFLVVNLGDVLVRPFQDAVIETTTDLRKWINLKKLLPLRPDLDPGLLKKIIDARNSYLGDPALESARLAERTSLEKFMQTIFGRSVLSSQLKSDFLTGRLELVRKYEKAYGRLAFGGLRVDLLERDLSHKTLGVDEEVEIMKVLAASYRFEALQSDFLKMKVAELKLTATEIFKLTDLEARIRQMAAQTPLRKDSTAFADLQKTCQIRVNQFLAAAPSALRLKKSLELFQQVKLSALKVLPTFFADATLQAVSDSVNRLDPAASVATPLTLSEVENRARGLLRGQERIIAKRTSQLHSLRSQLTDVEKMFLFADELAAATPDGSIDPALQSFCADLRVPSFEDQAMLSENAMVIGWESSLFPDVATGIWAHEIGHLVSRAAQGFAEGHAGYDAKRYCSQVRSFYLKSGLQTTLYAEEDWADDFAISVLQNLKQSSIANLAGNFACALIDLDKDPGAAKYAKLSFDPPPTDTHSTTLLRALRVQTGLGGKAPTSCRSILGEAYQKIEKRSCQ